MSGQDKVVVKLSGNLILESIGVAGEGKRCNRSPRFDGIIEVLSKLAAEERLAAVVVGGGSIARAYISALGDVRPNKSLQDIMGIEASRLNARLIALALHPRAPIQIPTSPWDLLEAREKKLVPVLGGFQPGQSTNAVAMIAAETLGAGKVVNALAGVEGVYDKRPGAPDARLIPRMSLDDLWKLVEEYRQEPGSYELIDHLALQIARRSKITIHFVNGCKPETILKAVENEQVGTIVYP